MKGTTSRFGFSVNKDRQIDFDGNDHSIASAIAKVEPTINLCISCGTCSATCTAGKFTNFSLRRVILLVKRGETKGLSLESMKCMMCGKCILVCPRGVNTRNLILQINRVLQTSEP